MLMKKLKKYVKYVMKISHICQIYTKTKVTNSDKDYRIEMNRISNTTPNKKRQQRRLLRAAELAQVVAQEKHSG